MKKFLLGTLGAAAISLVTGFLVFGLALHSFMPEHTMTGVMKEEPDFLWLILGHLFMGATITYIFMKWAGISTLKSGAIAGFALGFLIAFSFEFTLYGVTNTFSDLPGMIMDGIGSAVVWTAAGMGSGFMLGKVK